MNYDLIVIGGGPAGYLASERAGQMGKTVLCIDKGGLGGVCVNEGCIPTKTLLYSAKLKDGVIGTGANTKYGEKYGVFSDGVTVDHAKVVARKNKVVKVLSLGIKSALKESNVTVINGEAEIVGNENGTFSVSVNDEVNTCERLLIATGSSPVMPPIPGLSEGVSAGKILTNREILALTTVPEKLVIVGGGVIGLEMASYFTSVGSEVTVIEMLDHIAGENDSELGELLKASYEKKGVKFLLSTKVVEFADNNVKCLSGEEEIIVPFDYALMSIGRRANTVNIGIEKLGVELVRGAIVTDEKMSTNIKNVYAAGDCNGKSMLAHTAYREAEVAINNMFGIDDKMDYTKIPAVIYTNPELASIGETEKTATEKGMSFRVIKQAMRFSGRYLAENEGGNGIFKLLVNNNTETIIGAQALCNYSSEFIASVAVMMEAGMTLSQIKKVVFPHPTVCEIIREAVFAADKK